MSRARALFVPVSVCLIAAAGASAQQPQPPVPAIPQPPMSLAGPPGAAPAVAPPVPGQLQAVPSAPLPPAVSLPPLPGSNAVPAVPLSKAKPGSSTSTTGQFIVHGDELTLRSALSSKCETISAELRTLLHDKQSWSLPIVVLLNTGEKARKPGQTVSTAISQLTHGGFHIQVTVNMRPDLRPADLRKEVVRALLAERILREQKEIVSKRKLLLPDWLFLGTLEALDYRQRARPSALFAALFKSGKIFGIEEIIEASASDIDDALSKTIYQTSCCALVLALLDQPDAGLRMGKFLNALASDTKSERDLLNQWFPNFASTDASLNKWWALQLATLASPGVGEPLSPQETVKALEDALTFRFQAKASELPQSSRRVIAPKPAVNHNTSPAVVKAESKPAPVDPGAPLEGSAELGEKRSFLGRLNPFAKRKDGEDEIVAAIHEAALAEAQSAIPNAQKPAAENAADAPPAPPVPPPVPVTSEPVAAPSAPAPHGGRKPLFDRWFGEEKKDKPETEAPAMIEPAPEAAPKPAPAPAPVPAPAPKPEKKEPVKLAKKEAKPAAAKSEAPKEKAESAPAPVPAPATEEPAEAEKKPSGLNPLKWFRGGKKDAQEAPATEDAPPPAPAPDTAKEKGKKAALAPAPQRDWLTDSLFSGKPLIAFVYQQVAVEAPAPAAEPEKEKKGIFGGLFGKKKDKADAPEPAEAAQPAPEKEKEKPKSKSKEKDKAVETPPAPTAEEPKKAKDTPPADEKKGKAKAQESEPTPASAPMPPAESPESESETADAKPKRSLLPFHLFGGKKDDEAKEAPAPATDPAEAAMAAAEAQLQTSPPEKKPEPKPEPVRKPRPAAKPEAPKDGPAVAASLPIEDYETLLKRKDLGKILERNVHALNALQSRGSVLFRPIAAEYVDVMESILKGKTKGLDARIRALRERTENALEQSKAVRDLLDLHEANESPALSGLFEDYLKLPETVEKELPERNDPVSRYLDALDKEFSKE